MGLSKATVRRSRFPKPHSEGKSLVGVENTV
jgi:hypothetical protein